MQACIMAKRGHDVELFELRDGNIQVISSFRNPSFSTKFYFAHEDIRLMEHVPGRSINLAMSIRGRSALKEIGLEDEVIKNHGLPMEKRMIHRPDGSTYPIPYGRKGQV